MNFVVGSVVRLNSGSMDMTVVNIIDGCATVNFFNDNGVLVEDLFKIECLKKVFTKYQQMVLDEKNELDYKLVKLQSFIENSEIYAALQQDEKDRLRKQRGFIEGYSIILTERINAF